MTVTDVSSMSHVLHALQHGALLAALRRMQEGDFRCSTGEELGGAFARVRRSCSTRERQRELIFCLVMGPCRRVHQYVMLHGCQLVSLRMACSISAPNPLSTFLCSHLVDTI